MKNSNYAKISEQVLAMGLMFMLISGMVSCKNAPVGQTPTNLTPPSPITNVVATPTPGGAKVSYDLPDETDISYVKCEYTYKGVPKIVRSSIYNDYLLIEGLGEIAPCNITLYLVNHSEVASPPVAASFTPLEPPVETVFKSAVVNADFGGVAFYWENETETMIGAALLAMDDDGKWVEKNMAFSSLKEDMRAIRGFNTENRMFGVVFSDRFGNTSDTLKVERTPWFEIKLNTTLWNDAALLGDNNSNNNNRPLSNIWDGKTDVIWHNNLGTSTPERFTINLGTLCKFSRFVIWQRMENMAFLYWQHNPRLFRIYATDELKYESRNPIWATEEWKDDWDLLGEFEVVKPSGRPNAANAYTEDDRLAAVAGHEFNFQSSTKRYQYLRFEIIETWQYPQPLQSHIGEVTIYGNDTDDTDDE